jgi:glycosyltransferase involved in cell wall biosynthesis
MRICTIVARNYLAQARVLAESFRAHHPEGQVSVLVVDDVDGRVDADDEGFDVISPTDLDIPRFYGMAAMYDVTELCTAVKPWLLRRLLATGEPITYFDPDIRFYAPVDEVEVLAREHQVVLIPHITAPLPRDGLMPDDQHLLSSGTYNLGFVAFGPGSESEALLDWWSDRLRFDCVIDHARGYFVDQRWFDLVPGMFATTAVLSDPGMNVAYWNLHERRVSHAADGAFQVGDRPLRFFHFSGFVVDRPHVVSKHQNRVRLSDDPLLAGLFADYAREVQSHRRPADSSTPYPFDALPDGRKLGRTFRRLYREGEREGVFELSPFSPDGAAEFTAWLREVPSGDAKLGLSRFWLHVYRERPDLQREFPDLHGTDRARFVSWIATDGARQLDAYGLLPLEEIDEVSDERPSAALARLDPPGPSHAAEAPWGVNVSGFLQSELGTGEAARALISALDAAKVPVMPIHGAWRPGSRQGYQYAMLDTDAATFPVNLICVNADVLDHWVREAGTEFFAGRYNIGLWWWETSKWPDEWLDAFDHVDEVWVATEHVRDAIAPVATVPVTKITLPVWMPTPAPRTRAELGLPEGFLFLFMFDYHSVFERKNAIAAVEAFTRAFGPGEGAKLAIKTINQENRPEDHERLLLAATRHPDVHIVEGYISAADKDSMIGSADCYVSLHRAEGLGLTPAEALYLGKPVIATRYSGNLDFMTDEGSWLVDFELVPIGPGNWPYPEGGEWAEPDVEQAAVFMREIFNDPVAAEARAAIGAAELRRTHSREAAGRTVVERLELLRRRRTSWPSVRHGTAASHGLRPLSTAVELLDRGPAPTRSSSGHGRSLVRRSLLRAIRPYTAFEQQVDKALVGAVGHLHWLARREASRSGWQASVMLAALREEERRRTELRSHVNVNDHERLDVRRRLADAELRLKQLDVRPRLAEAELRLKQLEGGQLETDRGLFLALADLRRAHAEINDAPASPPRSDGLTGFEMRGYSQNGEDGVLAEILRRIGTPTRWFVEFGVESGREGNSIYLADVAGWSGLFIEADPERFRALSKKYEAAERITTIEAVVNPNNVEELFERAGVPAEPDILSIDVDGADYWIWQAIESYRPRVVVIEYNSLLDAHRALVQPADAGPWDGTDYFGASIGAIALLGERKGYRIVHAESSGVNAFLVRSDLAEGRFPSASEVLLRRPNYFQNGYRHPIAPKERPYLDLCSGQMVAASTATIAA